MQRQCDVGISPERRSMMNKWLCLGLTFSSVHCAVACEDECVIDALAQDTYPVHVELLQKGFQAISANESVVFRQGSPVPVEDKAGVDTKDDVQRTMMAWMTWLRSRGVAMTQTTREGETRSRMQGPAAETWPVHPGANHELFAFLGAGALILCVVNIISFQGCGPSTEGKTKPFTENSFAAGPFCSRGDLGKPEELFTFFAADLLAVDKELLIKGPRTSELRMRNSMENDISTLQLFNGCEELVTVSSLPSLDGKAEVRRTTAGVIGTLESTGRESWKLIHGGNTMLTIRMMPSKLSWVVTASGIVARVALKRGSGGRESDTVEVVVRHAEAALPLACVLAALLGSPKFVNAMRTVRPKTETRTRQHEFLGSLLDVSTGDFGPES
mmetsp:Transcript_15780/g.43041  ORF Transcript_15780/g.43041 Transcript_15780/m.43041 type:complete len:386 (-) Transcript_15780:7-1164(-)